MKKEMTIFYEVHDNIYVNLTNKCPCACTFCLRQTRDHMENSHVLWLEHAPSFEEVQEAMKAVDFSKYKEVVFCGFGEPTERLELLCKTAAYLKEQGVRCIRLNTNGLSDLLHERKTAQDLHGLVDIVSISLNAGTEEEYQKVTRPKFPNAFAALQEFAADCKNSVPTVMYSVVDVLPKTELDAAQALADRQGIPLRVRKFEH